MASPKSPQISNNNVSGISALVQNAEYAKREKLLRRTQIVSGADFLVFLLMASFSTVPYLSLISPYPLITIIGLRKNNESFLRCSVGYHLASFFLRITLMVLKKSNIGFIIWGCISLGLNTAAIYYNYVLGREMVEDKQTIEMV
jgi:hypothetical protein